jgi:acyl dehydratase
LVKGTLPAGTPGVGPQLPVTRAMVQYCNAKYDPYNAVLCDPEVAQQYGFADIQPFGTFGAHDDTFMGPYPFEARDTLLVSQLNHEVDIHRPVYPGDTLYLVMDRRTMTDRTPVEGSTYRTVSIATDGSVYNQRGEKVNTVVFRVCESVRSFKDGHRPADMAFEDSWDAPEWTTRPAHVYTDADWELITRVWRAENPRRHEVLHWEDVAVGDRPPWTLDGPIDRTVMPTDPYGMGTGGSRTLKEEILDPGVFSTMVRGEDGVYRLPDPRGHIPVVPDGAVSPLARAMDPGQIDTRQIHKEGADRSVLINFLARDVAIRHVNNWIGYAGRLVGIRWEIMSSRGHAAYGKPVPAEAKNPRYLMLVPDLRDADITIHGLTGDVALVKSYVYDHYVRDGQFLVELAWWIENIENDIWAAGAATVALPSRGARAGST